MEETKNDFDVYQDFTDTVALYPKEVGLAYTLSGLCGETAEVAEKILNVIGDTIEEAIGTDIVNSEEFTNLVYLHDLLCVVVDTGKKLEQFKKAVRKGEKKLAPLRSLTEAENTEIKKEIGDAEWYIAQISRVMNSKLSEVVKINVEKLLSRKARNTLHGNGDSR